MKKFTITIVLILVAVLAMPVFGQSFSDVPSDHWAYDAINKLVAAGVIEGYPDGEYKGQKSMSRYEMAVMVSRALDNIVAEQEALRGEVEAMGQGLTNGQAEDVTAIVRSLMAKNMPEQETLSDSQAQEVADIVDALTFELAAELKVIGADLDALGKDFDDLEAKVDALDIPEDNIELGATINTIVELADYGDQEKASVLLWRDDYVLDWPDPDEYPAEKRLWQEIGINVSGNLGEANFNLNVDTINNLFTEEDSLDAYGVEPMLSKHSLEMDSALLELSYKNFNFEMGDLGNPNIAPYFYSDEDAEGIVMDTSYMDNDIKAFTFGVDIDEDDAVRTDGKDYYGLSIGRDLDIAYASAKLYHAKFDDGENTTLGVAAEKINLNDLVTLNAEAAFNTWEENTLENDDIYLNINGEFNAADDVKIKALYESVGENYYSPNYKLYNTLEEAQDYQMAQAGVEYILNENNMFSGNFTTVMPGDTLGTEDKLIFNFGLDNVYGDFTNNVFLDYVQNENYVEDHEVIAIGLGTEYSWNETTTIGASLINKNEEVLAGDIISYNYIQAFLDKALASNVNWNTTLKYVDGTVGAEHDDLTVETDGTGAALTSSVSVSF